MHGIPTDEYRQLIAKAELVLAVAHQPITLEGRKFKSGQIVVFGLDNLKWILSKGGEVLERVEIMIENAQELADLCALVTEIKGRQYCI